MECVTLVKYYFLINGSPRGFVTPTRGLRQGDPLSPYLFLLCTEGFYALVQRMHDNSSLVGIKVCKRAPILHHLLFADDSFLFAQATLASCYQIKHLLDVYATASGLELVSHHDKYLGLPTLVGRSKKNTFSYLKDRLRKRLSGWKGKLLSGAGKELLIKVVGNGNSIAIWEDGWIPRPHLYRPLFPFRFPTTLSSRRLEDKLVWHYDIKGVFSVKSAYLVARDNIVLPILSASSASSSSSDVVIPFWKKFRKIKVPGKVKLCLWKACRDFLPTRANLVKKHVDIPIICPLCEVEEMSNDNFCRLLVKCWLLWKARNDKVWKNKACHPQNLRLSAQVWYAKYLQANVAPPLAPRPRYRWKKPNCGWFSVCMDGALDVTSQVSSPAHIEALAGKVACNLVLEHGFSPARLETNSLLLVQAIHSIHDSAVLLRGIYEDVLHLFAQLSGCTFTHLYKDGNYAAHTLARWALNCKPCDVFFTSSPHFLEDIITRDCN
ncbi:hypothetical protein ACLB2K_059115 [Fragaria x ananassa]